ncbi:MAG: hypothetical protein QOG01_3386 [Pseudonocardiales bacterium]|jgi:PPOX class probable F420-dependent enzyme|nr:hypothetical protein [Pseudonocardiales bacterium]
MDADAARARFAVTPVARLATASADARPHVVPIVFALAVDVVYTAVDGKPKTTTALRRLANVEANPQVAVLVDHYQDDWTRLWWARADGNARILATDEAEAADALALLTERYPVYATQRPPGPVIAIDVTRWSGWAAAPDR